MKDGQPAPPCDCGVVPHRTWCARKEANDRAYDRIVAVHAQALVLGPRGYYMPRP